MYRECLIELFDCIFKFSIFTFLLLQVLIDLEKVHAGLKLKKNMGKKSIEMLFLSQTLLYFCCKRSISFANFLFKPYICTQWTMNAIAV